ncbi:hypothetical protein L208DRAFT_1231554 [Tricholoma matsutake]|nr:hypothetical protein L208DRAFT_1231554 [Tricholoma matsutake 945]
MTNFTSKNQSKPVFFQSINQKIPVLGGPVQSPQYLGQSWTSCSCGCPIWKSKNRTGPDFRTLRISGGSNSSTEDGCARRMFSFNFEASEMNCRTWPKERSGYLWFKGTISCKFREDIAECISVWWLGLLGWVGLLGISNTQMSSKCLLRIT